MRVKLLVIFLLIIGLGLGSYYAYTYYFPSPEKVLLRASEQFSQLKTVHADMDILTTMHVNNPQTGAEVSQESKISGFSDMNIQDKTQKMHMSMSSGGNTLDIDMILLTGGQMYMKMPILGQNWISINTSTLKKQGNLPIDPQSNDYVTQSMGFLKSVDKNSIIKLEDEVLDGIKTSHYRVDISTPQYLEYLRQLSDDGSLANSFKDATIKTDLWIDQKTNYIVKMESVVKNLELINKNTNTSMGTSDTTFNMSYSRYNQSIIIGKPEGNIVSYEDLLKKAQGSK
jgi:hypothetical protein